MSVLSGVDQRQLKALLRAYFRISTRAVPIGRSQAKSVRTLPVVLALYTLFGFGLGLAAVAIPSVLMFGLVLHMLTFFLVGSTALNEASEILFSSRDGDVLNFRPVSPATIVLAKALTLLGFCLLVAFSVNLGGCVLGALCKDAHGWFALAHLSAVIVETVFLCGFVVCVHGVIVRRFGAERFQRVVTAVQIASIVVLMVGFQILPRVMTRIDVAEYERFTHPVWLAPPAWFAGWDAWMASKSESSLYVWPTLLALVATAVVVWLGVVRLPNGVARTLGQSHGAIVVREPEPERVSSGRGFLAHRAWSLWMRDPVQRAVFRLCALQLLRERSIKLRLAGSLAYFLILPVLAFLDERNRTTMPAVLPWLTTIQPLSVLFAMRFSPTPEAGDLFWFSPIRDRMALLEGARKAALTFIVLPVVVYTLAIVAWLSHENTDVLWMTVPTLFLVHPMSLVPGWRGDYVPFSLAAQPGERSSNILIMFLSVAPAGVVVLLLLGARALGLLVPAVIAICVLAVIAHYGLKAWIRRRAQRAPGD